MNFTCAQAPVDMEGVTCRFHHPVPVAAGVSKPFNSTCSGAYMRGHSLGNHNFESFTAQSKRPSVSSDKISLKTVSCLSNHSSQAPRMHPLPEQTPLKPKWSCQLPKKSSVPNAAPFSSDRISRKTVPRLGNHSSHALGAYSHQEQILHQPMKTADVSTNNLEQIQCEECPHRLGQPECSYFTITGNCKYKSSCRYHHPKDISSKSHVCTLNSKGLPPRPDKRICRHYEQFGICKFGPRCLYDHPENYSSSAFQLDTFPEPSSASKLVWWE